MRRAQFNLASLLELTLALAAVLSILAAVIDEIVEDFGLYCGGATLLSFPMFLVAAFRAGFSERR